MWDKSNPHVLTNLYTTANTMTLTNMRTSAVTIFANAFKPESGGSSGAVRTWELRRFPARPRASAGKARLCVNVNL